MAYEPPGSGKGPVIGEDMSDDDQHILRLWRESLTLLDPRYEDKRLLLVAARAMVDDEFRARVAAKDEADANEPAGSAGQEPPLAEVRLHVNTPETLHVVLPPRAGEAAQRPPELREALRSRTSADAAFKDDWNISDPSRDIVITFPVPDGTVDGVDVGFPIP